MDKLNLAHAKPLVFIKVQTTGLSVTKDRIVEMSFTKVDNVTGEKSTGTRLINPEVAIPEEATKIHGITDEMVKSKPKFKEIAEAVAKFLDGCDFVGFNISKFDLMILGEEFNRAGVEFLAHNRNIIDLATIYHAMEPRDLNSAYKLYCNAEVAGKPGSEQTTEMYFQILNGIIGKYNGIEHTTANGDTRKVEPTAESLSEIFCKNKKQLDLGGLIVMNDDKRPIFNPNIKLKYAGKLVSESMINDSSYFDWFINVSEFPADTKAIVKKIVEKAKSASTVK